MSVKNKTKKPRELSVDFRIKLLKTTLSFFAVAIAVVVASLSFFIQSSTSSLLNKKNEDIKKEVKEIITDNIGRRLLSIFETADFEVEKLRDNGYLKMMVEISSFDQLSIVNSKGVVELSSDDKLIGYDLSKNNDFEYYIPIFNGKENEIYYEPMTVKSPTSKKYYTYSVVQIDKNNCLFGGCKEDDFASDVLYSLYERIRYNSVGEQGFTAATDLNENYLAVPESREITDLKQFGFSMKELSKLERNHIYSTKIKGESFFYSYDIYKQFYIITFIPETEVSSTWIIMMGIISALVLILMISMFIRISHLNKKLIVKNIDSVNAGLTSITNGNLDTVIDVRTHKEFSKLSDDINSTVDTLKGYIEREAKRIDDELAFARTIQLSALPNVFPPFPERKDIDIYASMQAAKTVGGDFYDFFFTDKNNLVFLIADVSDKGIPAAMFMMKAKAVVKSLAQAGNSVDEVLYIANNILADGNEENMFVTLWIGVLNTDTGELEYSNAGHGFPIIKSGSRCGFLENNEFSLSLGLMKNIRFTKYKTAINKGDCIFLYTDGATDANNTADEQYGKERLIERLRNIDEGKSSYEICSEVNEDIKRFSEGTTQFDDLTMMAVILKADN